MKKKTPCTYIQDANASADAYADADDSADKTISQPLHAEEPILLLPPSALMSVQGIAAVSAASTKLQTLHSENFPFFLKKEDKLTIACS